MRITVFTPAYNRGYIIENLYHSLQRQSFTDFEWLVVDDGSQDDTPQRFEKFMKDNNPFPIRYFRTENGGKHRAINYGLQRAEGELFFIVDSDDYLTDNALEGIDRMEKTIPSEEKYRFAGVCGLKGYATEKIIGSTFAGEVLDATELDRDTYGITGDKSEVVYTRVMRQYPFPAFEGEKFLSEGVVWDKMSADGWLFRFYNEISIICQYLDDGLTKNIEELYWKNPKGYGLFLSLRIQYGKIVGIQKWETYLSYYYNLRDRIPFFEISRNLHMNPMVLWLRLFGMRVFYLIYDR